MNTARIGSSPSPTSQPTPDLRAIKARQQETWSSGDYPIVGTMILPVAESLCDAADIRPGERVLDVPTGHGNAAIAAARRFGRATGVDYVPALLERGRERARAERLPVEFVHGDAEDLAFPDASFDVVLSTFGVMFAPDQTRAARELARVCRPGGRIGLASWTPDSSIAEMFRIVQRHVPGPAGLVLPARWGDEEHLHALLGDAIGDMQSTRREFVFRYASIEHWMQVMGASYGPLVKTFGALDADRRAALVGELERAMRSIGRSSDASLVFPSAYLESVIVRA